MLLGHRSWTVEKARITLVTHDSRTMITLPCLSLVPYIHNFGHRCLVKKVIHGPKPIKTPHHVFVLPIMRFGCNFQSWVLLTYWGFCPKLLEKWTFLDITFITKNCVPALKIANFGNKTACGGAHQRCASRLHNPVAVDPPPSCSIRFPNSLCGLAERAGCILSWYFLLRHWRRFRQPSLLIKALVSKNVYIRYVT